MQTLERKVGVTLIGGGSGGWYEHTVFEYHKTTDRDRVCSSVYLLASPTALRRC